MLPKRLDQLNGATYKAKLPNGKNLYVTVNEQDGRPFEIFVRQDDPHLHEWVAALTVMVTRCLQAGQGLADIAAELQEIHGPHSAHMVPGTQTLAPSIVARLGWVLMRHAQGGGL